MKNIRINLIITLVAVAVMALLLIQFFQVTQLYDKKSDQLRDKTISLAERTVLLYDKANDYNRYLSLNQKDFGEEYKQILKEEFKNLLAVNKSIDIKDTNLIRNGKVEKYLIIKGQSHDSISGVSAEHRVMARDVREVSQVFNRESGAFPENTSYEMSEQLDERVMDQIFRKSKYISSMLLQVFRENGYQSPNERINLELLDSILSSEVKRSNLPAKFQFSILDEKLNPIEFEITTDAYTTQVDTSDLIYTNIFPGNVLEERVFLAIDFESKTTFLVKQIIGVFIISIGLVIIIFITLAFMFRTIIRQKQLSELKNDFISNITHEFKTPISTISLACQALEDKDMSKSNPDDMLPLIRMIVSENNRLSTLVESVIQSSLMDQGGLNLEIEENNLSEIVRVIAQFASQRIEALNGVFTLDIPNEDVFIECDRLHTSQMILKLIDNAIKYSNGNPVIKIILRKENTGAVLSVMDSGIGINNEHISKIFDKLYRVPTGNVHNVKGFGLGLNYVDSIVKSHHWEIKVRSKANKGSEFTITMI